LTYTLCDY